MSEPSFRATVRLSRLSPSPDLPDHRQQTRANAERCQRTARRVLEMWACWWHTAQSISQILNIPVGEVSAIVAGVAKGYKGRKL
jgi:hypothetical protein